MLIELDFPRDATLHSGGNGKWRSIQDHNADLCSALWTLGDEIRGIILSHGEQAILGHDRFRGNIHDAAFQANRTAKRLAGFFFHSASISLFSILRTAS
jgi:hypothetical protein